MNQLNKRTEQETVLPPTYAKLPTIKLEEEPNPFEESFEANIVGYSVMTEKYHYKDKERKKRTRKTKMREEEDVKRKNFLERNRIAHKDCLVNQQEIHRALNQPIPFV
ncbi:hypothetical protein RO3G_13773 [Rhizopus delemar RA 99-880]|uniref:Transcription factor Aft1 osmotic stress domain-containing protein n=1 Tax=Rhizopus delemar (strain RA 99-880 / ATCC MYA-4621 / FGSC 9543 / NRRL 43880) TaxID=246409 RepID=I1CKT2_RHIO9|nr:hypothetical protein RO3G_13773 [Rhizopus delemar RA 99-880]|eukprot:EIE89062.1 hypothetical protein RO3G_13773 [Rhizopus delemar RA 99-880]